MTAPPNHRLYSERNMKVSIAIIIWLWFATISIFIPSATADKELVPSNGNVNRSLEARSDDVKVLKHPRHLRKLQESAEEGKSFTLWDFDAISTMVPEYSQYKSSSAWPILVATVSAGNGNVAYHIAPMPSGVKPNLDYILNFGQRHGDLTTLILAISDHAVNKDQVTEPEITSSQLQALINYWGWGDLGSKGNCYRYAAWDPAKCSADHQEIPGDVDYLSLTPSNACDKLKEYAKYDGMRATPCNSVDILVAVVAAFDDISNQFLDFHWYRQMYDGRWTHKPGHTKVRDTDASGRKITNPKTCNRNNIPIGGYNYQYFCGYLCVPKGKIDLDKYDEDPCYY
jgi:hypothetical protein